jgi:hypothetical protein
MLPPVFHQQLIETTLLAPPVAADGVYPGGKTTVASILPCQPPDVHGAATFPDREATPELLVDLLACR